jgi:hypothetical protein
VANVRLEGADVLVAERLVRLGLVDREFLAAGAQAPEAVGEGADGQETARAQARSDSPQGCAVAEAAGERLDSSSCRAR